MTAAETTTLPSGVLDTAITGADSATVIFRCGEVEQVVEFAAGAGGTLLVEGLSLTDAADGTFRPADGVASGEVRIGGPVRLVQRRPVEVAEVRRG